MTEQEQPDIGDQRVTELTGTGMDDMRVTAEHDSELAEQEATPGEVIARAVVLGRAAAGAEAYQQSLNPVESEPDVVITPESEVRADPRRDRVLNAVDRWLNGQNGRQMRAKVLMQRLKEAFSLNPDTLQEYLDVGCSQGILFEKDINGSSYYLNHQLTEVPRSPVIQASNEHRSVTCDETEVANAILNLLAQSDMSIVTGYTPKQLQSKLYHDDYIGRGRQASGGRVKDVMRKLIEAGVMDKRERSMHGRASIESGQLTAGLASIEVKTQLQKDPDYRDEILALFNNPEIE